MSHQTHSLWGNYLKEDYGVKSLKTVLTGALVAGLLLMSANGALAAYTGTYINDNDNTKFVDLGTGTFTIDGTASYALTYQNGNVWGATGASDYYYGYANGPNFAFFKSANELSSSAITTLSSSIESIFNSIYATLDGGGSIDDAIAGVSTELFFLGLHLADYNLRGTEVGYGTFADDGMSFEVTASTLDKAGLRAMLCENCSETYTATPIPAAVWLLGSGLVGLVGLRRRMRG